MLALVDHQGAVAQITLRGLASRSREEARSRLLTELKALSPVGFEYFCIELLEQLGYSNLSVTRRSGDGGIVGIRHFNKCLRT